MLVSSLRGCSPSPQKLIGDTKSSILSSCPSKQLNRSSYPYSAPPFLREYGVRKHQTRNRTGREWGMWISFTTFLLSTAHFTVTFYQYYGLLGGSERFSVDNLVGFARFALAPAPLVYINVIAASLILSWRVLRLYNNDWKVIAAPLSGTVALAILSFGSVAVQFQEIDNFTGTTFNDVYDIARAAPVRSWALSSIIISTTTTLMLSGLIMYKLFAHQRESREYSTLGFDILMLLESGLIYASAWVIYLVLYLAGNQASIVAFDSIAQLAGIVPSLIIVLSSAGYTLAMPPMYTDRRPSAPSTRVETTMNFGPRQDTQFSVSMGDTELSTNIESKKSKERLDGPL
ncbi:hypothetical protein ONZ45_g10457 [Pleurotus djamor]|nr:hypothetical protein ONZ45_g10457 [Pleurotus djamor]